MGTFVQYNHTEVISKKAVSVLTERFQDLHGGSSWKSTECRTQNAGNIEQLDSTFKANNKDYGNTKSHCDRNRTWQRKADRQSCKALWLGILHGNTAKKEHDGGNVPERRNKRLAGLKDSSMRYDRISVMTKRKRKITGGPSVNQWLLPACLCQWNLPHRWQIAYVRREDCWNVVYRSKCLEVQVRFSVFDFLCRLHFQIFVLLQAGMWHICFS